VRDRKMSYCALKILKASCWDVKGREREREIGEREEHGKPENMKKGLLV